MRITTRLRIHINGLALKTATKDSTGTVLKSDDGIKVVPNYHEYTRYGTGTQSDLLTLKVHLPPSCWREIFTRRPALKISNFGNEPETLPL